MVAVGDIYELAVQSRQTTSGVRFVNVYHFRQKGGFLSAINLIGEWIAVAQAGHRALLASDTIIERYSCRSLIPHGTDFYETTAASTGTNGTTAVPPTCAAIITWRTGLPGRRKRGRTYFGGCGTGSQTGGEWNGTFLGVLLGPLATNIVSAWGAGGSSAQTEIGVWSRLNAGPSPPYNPAGFQVITAASTQRMVATMGTRRKGRGY